MGQGRIDYTRAQIADLLDRIDNDQQDGASRERMFSYRVPNCVIVLREPAGAREICEQLPTRSLGQNTLRFIIGRFVNLGSTCQATLITRHGSWQVVHGEVHECTYVENGIHEVVVHLDAPVEPAEFCKDGSGPRILVVEDNRLVAEHAGHILKECHAMVELVDCGEDAIKAAAMFKPHGIMLDIKLPDMDGYEVIRRLNERNYSGSIVAYTATSVDEAHCRKAGFAAKLRKPLDLEELSSWLDTLREEPILSDLHGDGPMRRLIAAFVEELPSQVHAMRMNQQAAGAVELERLSRDLCIAAQAHGFHGIAEEAGRLMESVRRSDAASIESSLDCLEDMSARVRSPESVVRS